jgi:RNA polymerase sigma-70 factor (ECF subfamily)
MAEVLGLSFIAMNSLVIGRVQTTEERDWAHRVRERDLGAISVIYDDHHGALCSFAKGLLGDDQAAEDLVHDVFVLLPRVIDRLQPGRSLRSFLLAIAANNARHHFRSAKRRRQMAERLGREPTPTVENPEDHAQRRVLAEALRRALDLLPNDERLAFVLCEIEGHTSPDASEILGVPEGTVRRRLFYARQKLRERLAKEGLL